MSSQPISLFVGHGAPTLALSTHPSASFLNTLGKQLQKPSAVIIVSPHWQTAGLEIRSAPHVQAHHDFSGFDPALYQLRYDAPGAPQLLVPVVMALQQAGFAPRENPDPRIDHGVWVPLMRIFPAADVPVLQLSLPDWSPIELLKLGAALGALAAEQGALVIASGSLVHNLRQIIWQEDAGPQPWAKAFEQWLDAALRSNRCLLDAHAPTPVCAPSPGFALRNTSKQ